MVIGIAPIKARPACAHHEFGHFLTPIMISLSQGVTGLGTNVPQNVFSVT
jgi:hypothetical protein